LSVKDFGAAGDGVTDDTAAIQATFNSATPGSTVSFEPGLTYLQLGQVKVSNGQNLSVLGRGATIKAGTGTPLWGTTNKQRVWWFQDCKGLTISDLTFDCNGQNLGATSLWWAMVGFDSYETDAYTPTVTAQNLNLRRCQFLNVRVCGLGARSVKGMTIKDCQFLNGYQSSSLAYAMASLCGVSDLTIDNTVFDGGSHTTSSSGMIGTLCFVSPQANSLTDPYRGGLNAVPTISYTPQSPFNEIWRWTAPAAGLATPDATVSYATMTVLGGSTPDMSQLDYFFLCESAGSGANSGIVPSSGMVCTGIDTVAKTITVRRQDQNPTPTAVNWAGQTVYAYAIATSRFCQNVTVRDCRFSWAGVGAGLFLLGTRGYSVRGCVADHIGDVCLDAEWCCNGTFEGNNVNHVGTANMAIGLLHFCRNVSVEGNTLYGCTNSITQYSGSAVSGNIRIADNVCEKLGLESLTYTNVLENVTLENNTVRATRTSGAVGAQAISLQVASPATKFGLIRNTKIAHNRISGGSQRAIQYQGVDGLDIRGNVFSGIGGDAIYDENTTIQSTRVVLEDNTLDDVGSRNRPLFSFWRSAVATTQAPIIGVNHWRNADPSLDLTQNWYSPASTPTSPTGPRFLRVGSIWLRDNAGSLERSTNSLKGSDGTWAAVGAGSGGQLDAEMLALGYQAWTNPPWTWLGSQATVAGTLYLTICYVPAGTVVTGLVFVLGSVPSGVTLTRLAVYEGKNSGAALLASTGDITGSLTATGFKQFALSAPWTCSAAGLYYFGMLQVSGTPASIYGTGLPGGADPALPGKLIYAVGPSSLSDLPATGGTWVATNRAMGFAAY
jgi:hypothetical protein